jgi:protein arginine N-methyltransferase 5
MLQRLCTPQNFGCHDMPLGKRSDYGDSRYAGVEVPFSADGLTPLRAAVEGGFDFLLAPLTHPARRPPPPPPTPGAPITPIFTPDQGLFLSPDYGNQVVGKVSPLRRHPSF